MAFRNRPVFMNGCQTPSIADGVCLPMFPFLHNKNEHLGYTLQKQLVVNILKK